MKFLIPLFSIFVAAQSLAKFEAAYFDMQAAIQATSAGKNAKKSLEKEFNKKKDELKKQEDALKKEMADFEKKKMVLSETKRAEKQASFQKKMIAFQQELQKSQMNIQKKERDLTRPILEKIQKIVGDLAKKKGFSMVFEKSSQGVMWAKADLDLTQAIVQEFEKKK